MELNQQIRELEGQVLNKDRKNKRKLELETEEEVTTPSKKNKHDNDEKSTDAWIPPTTILQRCSQQRDGSSTAVQEEQCPHLHLPGEDGDTANSQEN